MIRSPFSALGVYWPLAYSSGCSGRWFPMVDFADLSPQDQKEIERFEAWLRLVSEAYRAGVPRTEAAFALYEDVFVDAEGFCMDIDEEAIKAMDAQDEEIKKRYEASCEREAKGICDK